MKNEDIKKITTSILRAQGKAFEKAADLFRNLGMFGKTAVGIAQNIAEAFNATATELEEK